MDSEIIKIKRSKSNREIQYDITYTLNLKKIIQTNLFTKQKQTGKQMHGYQRGRLEGIDLEFGIGMYTLLYLK